jgi:glycogen debranching enzyme
MLNQQFVNNLQLLPGEELISVEDYGSSARPLLRSSSLEEIYRLTAATKFSEVGLFGPSMAALPAKNSNPADTHQGLFDAFFGRDSERVALDLIDTFPRLAATTLLKLAETQGLAYDTAREEEPGRIVHEVREEGDLIAQQLTRDRGWGWPYYGTVDATPEFIRLLSAYVERDELHKSFLFQHYKDRSGQNRIMADALSFAVDWITMRLDSNDEGLLEYKSIIPRGIENQVWKDSPDAYHHGADEPEDIAGTIANHDQGIASIEVQAITYDALIDAAHIYETVLNRQKDAQELRVRAERLADTIMEKFWTEDKGGYFVLGTDRGPSGELRQLKVRTSNMGHLLNSRLLDGPDERRTHMRAAILRQLTSPELLTTAGIRTLASDEPRYRDGAYHNGSVWIWDTHYIAQGARRHVSEPAFLAFANDLDSRILHAVNTLGGFPEYVRGSKELAVNTRVIDVKDSEIGKINRVEQPPQQIQAWTVTAILATERRRGKHHPIA